MDATYKPSIILILYIIGLNQFLVGSQQIPPGKCSNYMPYGSLCDQIIQSDTVFIPDGLNITILQYQATKILKSVDLVAALAPNCAAEFIALSCWTTFLPCIVTHPVDTCHNLQSTQCTYSFLAATNISVPVPPCRELCSSAEARCSALFEFTAPPNCTALPESPPFCVPKDASQVVYALQQCPFPLTFESTANISNNEAQCQLPCPVPVFSDSEYEQAFSIMHVMAVVSLAMDVWLFVTTITDRQRWMFPSMLIYFLIFFSVMVTVPFLFSFRDNREPICASETISSNENDAFCVVQGTLIYYAALSGTLWWMFTAISLLDQLVKKTPVQNPVLKPVFISLGLGVPAVFTAVALGLKSIKYYPGNVFCFLGDDNSDGMLVYYLYIIPVGLMLCVGIITFIAIVVIFTKSSRKLRGSSKRHKNRLIRVQIGTMVYLFIFLYIYVFIFSFRLTEINNNAEQQVGEWIKCHLFSSTQLDPEPCADLPQIVNPTLLYWSVFNASSTGLFLFIPAVSSRSYWKKTCRLFRSKAKPRSSTKLNEYENGTTSSDLPNEQQNRPIV